MLNWLICILLIILGVLVDLFIICCCKIAKMVDLEWGNENDD